MKIRLLTGAVLLAWGITGAHAQSTDNSNDPTTQQFLKALEQRDTGDYLAEISALENILQSQPTLTRVHAELAVAYFQSLNFTAARAEAQKLLADPATPPAVRANLERLLTSIDRDSRTHLFTPYISLGYGHDTNVNVGPGADTIQIGGNAFSLAPGVPRQSDNYTQLNAGVSYRYLAPQQMQIMNRPASFLWQANASLYANEYSSLSKYSLEVATVSTGPSLVSAGRYRTSLNVQVDDISLGHQHIADYYGVNPNYTWIMGKAELALDASVQQRRFTGIANNGHDSNYQKVGLTYGRQLLDDRLTVQVGANTWKEDADLAHYSNVGQEYFAAAAWRPWQGGTISARYGQRQFDYHDVEPVFDIPRNDRETRTTLGISHQFQSGKMKDWIIGATVNRTQNRSNVIIYTYDRDQYGVTLTRTFL